MARGAGRERVCWRWEGDQRGTAAEVSAFDGELALALPVLALQCIFLLWVQAFPSHFFQVTGLNPVKAAEQYVWIRIAQYNVFLKRQTMGMQKFSYQFSWIIY